MSLTRRLLLAASLTLAAFLTLTALALERAFLESARSAQEERLQGLLYALLAAADPADGGVAVDERALDPRLLRPGSGLYAQIRDAGRVLWRSPSSLGLRLPPLTLPPGERRLSRDEDLALLAFGVAYVIPGGRHAFTFLVAEDMEALERQVQGFRYTLWGWLLGASLVLLALQAGILRWGLAPLRRAARDIRAVERGERERLEGPYPAELKGLVDNLNALIASDRERLERYRHSLSELAHALKTPLAVLKGSLDAPCETLRAVLGEQIEAMARRIDYQLEMAAASGKATLAAPLPVCPVLEKVKATLEKVHGGKKVRCTLRCRQDTRFRGGEGDLVEVLGNLMDNAFKWARKEVVVEARMEGETLVLRVDDDGPGIPEEKIQAVVQRGVRVDVHTPGHGIGLSVVQGILALYGGRLAIGKSPLGGTRVEVRW